MIRRLRQVPNMLTAIRLAIVPWMWASAFLGQRSVIGVGLLVGLMTDLLDGAVARKLDQTSTFGSKFDSLADQFLQLSSIVWVVMLMPEIFTENQVISLLAVTLYVVSLSVGLLKFGRMANLHLYLSKVGGLFLYLFLIHASLSGQYNPYLYYMAASVFILSSSETLLLQLISSRVNEHTGSILLRYLADDHPIRTWLSRLP